MKKLMITGALLMFGTLVMNAQTTPKKDNMRSKAEKNLKSTEMKMDTSAQNIEMNKKVDTFNIEQRQKKADEKLQRQTIPQKDGLNNETVKPAQPQPVPGQLE